jgi:hypothetical protein
VETAASILKDMDVESRERFDNLEEPVRKVFYDGMLNPWMILHACGTPDYFMNTTDLAQLTPNIRAMGRKFRQVKRVADRHAASVVAFSIPEGFYVNREAHRNVQRVGFRVVPEMLTTEVPDQAVERACQTAGIPFHSVLSEFRDHMDEGGLYFELDRHMTAAGNDLFAKTIAPMVVQHLKAAPPGPDN